MERTLASFEWLLEPTEHVIRCPQMYLDGWHDHEPPVFVGSGRFALKSSTEMRFELDAKARDSHEGMMALQRSSQSPADSSSAMRLRGIDYNGAEWNAGWVRPRLGGVVGDYLQLFGEMGTLTTHVRQREPTNGVELVYSPSPEVPFTEAMIETVQLRETEIGWRTCGGGHRIEVLGSVIDVMTQPWSKDLWICASTSDDLRHPYLENWLSEPLRALRGQLIFPRLVARNFHDGRALVSVRTTPSLKPSMGGCAIQLRQHLPTEFWSFYGLYLTYVAQHRGADGNPEFESNDLTRLHDEVIQARMAGSAWVIALCVATAVEGLVKLDPSFASTPPEFDECDLKPFAQLLSKLENEPLRKRLANFVPLLCQTSASKYLSQLNLDGKITKLQLNAWKKVRNQVAHGNLFEPWGTAKEHEQLTSLVELFYRLTTLRIGFVSPPHEHA